MSRDLLFIVNEAGYFLSHRLPLALAAREAGWRVSVATAPGAGQETIRAAGFTAHSLPLTRSGANPWQELRAIGSTWRLLRRTKPDLVHCVALKAIVAGGLAARFAGSPACVFAIAGLGHVFIDSGAKHRLLGTLFRALLPLLVGDRARVIVQNDEDLDLLGASATLRRRAVLIPGSGVDLARFAPTPEPANPVAVLVAGRMLWTKGIGEFVAAARLLRASGVTARFLLAGASDPGNPAAIPENELAHWQHEGVVEWLGQRDDMHELWSRCHIACLPSYREGLPKSLVEAAASARPIVASDVPGCRDVVRDGENGLLVPPENAEALAGALRRLLEDGALRRRLGDRGRQIACERFGLRDVVAATLSLYEDLVPASDGSEAAGLLSLRSR